MFRAAPLLALLSAVPLSGCAAILQNYGGPAAAALGPKAPPQIPYHDFKGVIHCHSYLSHDSKGTEAEIVDAANRVGLDFLIMTDHYDKITEPDIDKAIRGMRGKTLFIPGVEIRKDGGSLLILGPEENFDPKKSAKEVTEEIHRQGGLVFVGHLEEYRGDLTQFDFDGLEIYNAHAAAKRVNPLAMIFRALFLPPKLVFRSLVKLDPKNLAKWDQLRENRPVPICAGNDAHANVRIFGPFGGTIGTYEEMFHTVTTHVWAKELSKTAILDALRNGRSYVAFEVIRDATGFWVEKSQKEGKLFGKIFVPEVARIVLRDRDRIAAETQGQWLETEIAESRHYRVEVYLDDKIWILAGL